LAKAAVAGLALVLFASIAVTVVMGLRVRAHDRLDDDRRDAVAAAQQFALRMDAFDGSDIDAYVKTIEPMLTTKERASFTEQLQEFKQVYEEAARARKKAGGGAAPAQGRILLTGVTDADADSATVLIAHDTTVPGASQAVHARWTVSMRKVEGDWLVDSFVPVS